MENPLKGKKRLALVDAEDDESGGRAGLASAHESDWSEAVNDFLLDKRSNREEKTASYYAERLRVFVRWATETAGAGKGIGLGDFKARHMREYLTWRSFCKNPVTGKPITDTTRRHDAIAVRLFIKFCKQEDYIDVYPLADYKIPKASKSPATCPKDEDVQKLLKACQDRWRPALNPNARFFHAAGRQFFQRRNYAILAGLVSTGAREGEILALRLADYDPVARTVRFRDTKGDEDRTVPFEPEWGEIVAQWLRVRPKSAQSDTLFVTEYGDPLGTNLFRQQFYKDRDFAGVALNLHALRHYALTQIARSGDIRAAQKIAGHKSLSTTQVYLHADADRMQQVHAAAAPLGRVMNVMVNARSAKQRKKLIGGKS